MDKFLDRVERQISSHPATVNLMLNIMKLIASFIIGCLPLLIQRH